MPSTDAKHSAFASLPLKDLRERCLAGELGSNEASRPAVWLRFLNVKSTDVAEEYRNLVQKGKTQDVRKDGPTYDKIRGDADRTYKSDNDFTSKVSQAALCRIGNAFHHAHADKTEFRYMQGVANFAGLFLFAGLSEAEAYAALTQLTTVHMPYYFSYGYIGVTAGCALVNKLLAALDAELFAHLDQVFTKQMPKGVQWASLMWQPMILSLGTSSPPLSELLALWDVLIVTGFSFNVLVVVAQVLAMRSELLSLSGMAVNARLESRKGWPPTKARYLISLAMSLVKRLDPTTNEELLTLLTKHARDEATVVALAERNLDGTPLKTAASASASSSIAAPAASNGFAAEDDSDESDDPFGDMSDD